MKEPENVSPGEWNVGDWLVRQVKGTFVVMHDSERHHRDPMLDGTFTSFDDAVACANRVSDETDDEVRLIVEDQARYEQTASAEVLLEANRRLRASMVGRMKRRGVAQEDVEQISDAFDRRADTIRSERP